MILAWAWEVLWYRWRWLRWARRPPRPRRSAPIGCDVVEPFCFQRQRSRHGICVDLRRKITGRGLTKAHSRCPIGLFRLAGGIDVSTGTLIPISRCSVRCVLGRGGNRQRRPVMGRRSSRRPSRRHAGWRLRCLPQHRWQVSRADRQLVGWHRPRPDQLHGLPRSCGGCSFLRHHPRHGCRSSCAPRYGGGR